MTIILSRLLRGTSDTALVTWQTLGALAVGAVLSITTWRSTSALDFSACCCSASSRAWRI